MPNLLDEALGLQDFNAALEAVVIGQDGPVLFGGDCASQSVGRSALDAAAPAYFEQVRCLFAVDCGELFVRKRLERGSQIVELSQVLDSGQNLLPDWADDGNLTVLNRFRERCAHRLLIVAQAGLALPPQKQRPGKRHPRISGMFGYHCTDRRGLLE